jgi:hypothetical protein
MALHKLAPRLLSAALVVAFGTAAAYEVEAAYTTGVGTRDIVWTTTAQRMPSVGKDASECARTPDFMDGGICIKVAGGGLTSTPISWTFEWRPSHAGHETRWEPCGPDNGCLGYSPQYYADAARGVVHFRIWPKQRGDRDLRVRIRLSAPATPVERNPVPVRMSPRSY